jgi:hypothetical protein
LRLTHGELQFDSFFDGNILSLNPIFRQTVPIALNIIPEFEEKSSTPCVKFDE